MGNCFGRDGTDGTDGNPNRRSPSGGGSVAGNTRGTIEQVLMFPDKAMPCKYGKTCRRGSSCSYSHDNTSLKQFLGRLAAAKKSIDVCVFTITCNEIANELQERYKHGVQVRIISDGEQSHSQGSDIHSLARAGVPVRLGRQQNSHMHHKFAVIDGTVVITGSFNWTRQAVLSNRENVLITDSPGVREPYRNEFERLWREYANNKV